MTDSAITAEGLAKKYTIGVHKDPYGRLTEVLWSSITGPFRRNKGPRPGEEFWALRDVSFQVPRGSAVGIIGRSTGTGTGRPDHQAGPPGCQARPDSHGRGTAGR